MSAKLIEDRSKLLIGYGMNDFTFEQWGENKTLYWGKACSTEVPDTFMVMQTPVTCKDYVVDTGWRRGAAFKSEVWTQQQKEDPVFYIYFPTITRLKVFKDNVESFFNLMETQWGIPTLTKVHLLSEAPLNKTNIKRTCIVQADPIWYSNSTSFSVYMSMIRYLTSRVNIDEFDFNIPYKYYVSEYNYYSVLSDECKKILMDIYNNPKELFVKLPKITGYTYTIPGHGQTGLFFILANLTLSYANKKLDPYYIRNQIPLQYKMYMEEFYFGTLLHKKLYGCTFTEAWIEYNKQNTQEKKVTKPHLNW